MYLAYNILVTALENRYLMAQLPVNYCNDFKCELIIMCTKAVYTSLLICIKHVNGIVDHGKSKWNTYSFRLGIICWLFFSSAIKGNENPIIFSFTFRQHIMKKKTKKKSYIRLRFWLISEMVYIESIMKY